MLHFLSNAALMIMGFLVASQTWAEPLHALTLYGEQPKYDKNFKYFDYVNPNAPAGGVLKVAEIGSYDSFNPFIIKGEPVGYLHLIYTPLAMQSLDEPFSIYGLVAEKMERDPNNAWVRFFLRQEAKFHDGKSIMADDVAFTFHTLVNKGNPMYKAMYADVADVVIESPKQVLFKFKNTNNRELPLILGQISILPKHWWANRDFDKTTLEPPLGSGPYRVEKFGTGKNIIYKKVDNWWGASLAVNRGQYNFDQVNVEYFRDTDVALEAFKGAHFDYWEESSAKNWATAYDTPAVQKGDILKESIKNHNTIGMQGFVFNMRKPMFQDVRVRQALASLFDFQWANKNLFFGAYTRANSYFNNSPLVAANVPTGAELQILEPFRAQLPQDLFSQPFVASKQTDESDKREVIKDAYNLLTQAGWKIDNKTMKNKDGEPIKIEFLLVQPNMERVILPYKQALSDLGISLEIRRVDSSQYINRLRSRDFDMLVASFPQSNSPGNEQKSYWSSAAAQEPGSLNVIGVNSPVVDQLIDGLIASNTRENLVAHTQALDRVLLWHYYLVPNWYIDKWRVAYWKQLQHPKVTPLFDVGLMTWWMNTSHLQKNQTVSSPQE